MNEIKVFTVSSFDGIKVEKYIKPVTFHVVLGMNFFADVLQSWTDFFGGNSLSYQKKLKEINESVIEGIKDEVKKVGGNCAIGLKIDNDEISAQGKSMIMVTAFATAVIIKEDVNIKFSEQDTSEIDLERYKVSKELNNIKRKMESSNFSLNTPEYWQFFIDNHLTSQFDYLINLVFEYYKNNATIDSGCKNYLVKYLRIFNKEDIENKFYSFLKTKENLEDYTVLKPFLNLLENESLYYVNSTAKNIELMSSNEQVLFDCGFWLALEELNNYNLKDIENYKKAMDLFNNAYPIISPYVDDELECSKCEGKKTSRKNRCKRCGSDTRGIKRGDFLFDEYKTGDELIEVLEQRIEIINQAFEI